MVNILIINQKGGVGKTTIADELAFALERQGKSVSFVTTDAQGGAIHQVSKEQADYQVIDTAGVLTDHLAEWCKAANLILIPMLPSMRDLEPTLRTYTLACSSKTKAPIGFIINGYAQRGILDRQLSDYLEAQGYAILSKIPRTVALPRAAAAGQSVADFARQNQAAAAFDQLADKIIEVSQQGKE